MEMVCFIHIKALLHNFYLRNFIKWSVKIKLGKKIEDFLTNSEAGSIMTICMYVPSSYSPTAKTSLV
jgi:hypothetical protein